MELLIMRYDLLTMEARSEETFDTFPSALFWISGRK
jgi:hypothetical protein